MPGAGRSWNARRIVAATLALLVVLLVLGQPILPRVAADRISSRVGRYGTVQSVSVSSWPAVELLWGHVDSARVRARRLALSPAAVGKLLWEGRDVSRLDITAGAVRLGSLQLTDAVLRKRGSALYASALASAPAVAAALPEGFGVRLLRSEHGEVEVRANGALFGIGASVDAVAAASEGKLVAHPVGFLIEGVRLTLFSDPHVFVTGVAAQRVGGRYRLSISAVLR
jgi:hypothetical protein